MADSDVIVEAFTELAPHYEGTIDHELRRFWGLSYGEFVDWLIDMAAVREEDVILDVATGTGVIPLRLAKKLGPKGQVIGLDITPAMLKHGRTNIEAVCPSNQCVSVVCASAMAMPFAQGVFDVVICGLGTHHMDVPQMLAEMRRVLKVEGRLIMADVGASAFWRSRWGGVLLKILMLHYGLSRRSPRAQAEVEAFPNVRTADEWHALLSSSGFAQIEIAESRARRPWYPSALAIRAVARGF